MEFPSIQEMKEGRNLNYQTVKKIGFFLFDWKYLSDPEPCLVPINFDKVILVIAAENKLAKELDFAFVLTFCFQHTPVCGAQVLDTFGQFLLIEQNFIDTDEQSVCPIRIELAAKTVIGQVGQIISEHFFQPFQEGALTGASFFGYQAQDW